VGAVSGSFEERDLIDSRGRSTRLGTDHVAPTRRRDDRRDASVHARPHTENLDSHYSDGNQFDSDVERTLAQKWERSNTEWELVREDDVFDLGAEVMIP